MGKRVALKLDGNLEQGFQVTLEVGEESKMPTVEETGYLPPAPDLAQCLEQWQQSYQGLSATTRIILKSIKVQSASLSLHEQREACRQLAKDLEQHLKTWLESSEPFKVVDKRLRESLDLNEPIRVLIRTLDIRLHYLPWHKWDFIEQYTQAEVALGAPKLKSDPYKVSPSQGKVRILAILGDSTGINVEADRQLLESLPDARVKFLVQPTRQALSDQLWEQPWHILFFAGHSQTKGQEGRLYINHEDSLTVEEVKFGLKRSIDQGLQLAIFNSCDGLGLAYELEQLHLPQLIVMRQPIPDRVAQAFLKYFLTAFSGGELLYLAVRQARERLQENLEPEFPCAGWLPMIYQNPIGIPPRWQGWIEHNVASRPNRPSFRQIISLLRVQSKRLLPILYLSIATTLLFVGLRFLGFFEPLELTALDQMMQMRPDEGLDSRILIVEITDADIQAQQKRGELMKRVSTSAQTRGKSFDVSLSDQSLKQLLDAIAKYHPSVIGLDINRDFAVEPGQTQLANAFQALPLITICKAEDFEKKEIASIDPPPEVPINRIGFSDFQPDDDGVLRRHLLNMYPKLRSSASKCTVNNSFSTQVGFAYLHTQKIPAEFIKRDDHDDLRLGEHVYRTLRSHIGGYQKLPAGGGGNQIVLNYRASKQVATRVSLTQILENQINPQYITGNIVLIGVTAAGEGEDYWQTPYHPDLPAKTPGVVVQAHMVSQLVSAALPEEDRPLIWIWVAWKEIVWILSWSFIANVLVWQIGVRSKSMRQSLLYGGLAIVLSVILLYGVCFGILLKGGWVPLVPSILAIVLSASMMEFYSIRQARQPRIASTKK